MYYKHSFDKYCLTFNLMYIQNYYKIIASILRCACSNEGFN